MCNIQIFELEESYKNFTYWVRTKDGLLCIATNREDYEETVGTTVIVNTSDLDIYYTETGWSLEYMLDFNYTLVNQLTIALLSKQNTLVAQLVE